MKITFDGAAQTVTGSQYLLEVNGARLLLDCGMYQGHRADFYTRNQNFNYKPNEVDAVILSHAHIDHSGNLPNLVKQGYTRSIFATHATCHLADIMLQDSGHIQEADAEFINKRRLRHGEKDMVKPLYTQADAMRVAQHFDPKEYGEFFEPIPGVTAHLVDAGHILGSAAVVLDVKENGRSYRLWFSGDIGRRNLPLLNDPVLPENADYMIMECTYGDILHSDPEEAYQQLRQVVLRTVNRGGKVIIPAFAVGRTQELVYDLNRLMTSGLLPKIPVFVDSPLAVRASNVFKEFPQYFDAETQAFVKAGKHPALDFDQLTYIGSVEESKALNDRDDPMIIISASGMAETGRILHHLKNNIEDPRNSVLIVGWQAPDTLGRRLVEGMTQVKIFGEMYNRRAEVAVITGFSAHAGQDALLEYVRATAGSLKHLFLVHGEEDAESAFLSKLGFLNCPVDYPTWKYSVDI